MQRERAVVELQCLLLLSHFVQCIPDRDAHFRQIRIKPKRPLAGLNGFFVALESAQGRRQIGVRFGETGLDRSGFSICRSRLFEAAERLESGAEIVVGLGVLRPQRDRGAKVRNGFLVPAQLLQHSTEIVVCGSLLGIEPQRFLNGGGRLHEPSVLQQRDAQQIGGADMPSIRAQEGLIERNRLGEAALPVQGERPGKIGGLRFHAHDN